MIEKAIFWGLFLNHIAVYKEFFIKMIRTFGITYALKKILKGCGEGNKADVVSLAGYSMTATEFIKYVNEALKNGSMKLDSKTSEEVVKGLFPTLFEGIKEAIVGDENLKKSFLDSFKDVKLN